MNAFSRALAAIAALTTAIGASAPAVAVDLRITRVQFINSAGSPTTPRFGDATYNLRVVWTTTGTPAGPYSVRFTIADQVFTLNGVTTHNGGTNSAFTQLIVPLDGQVPWSVFVDPNNVAGDQVRANNAKSGVVVPVELTTGLFPQNQRRWRGSQTVNVRWGAGTVSSARLWLGVPVTESFQTVVSVSPPVGSQFQTTIPNQQIVHQVTRSYFTGTMTAWRSFVVDSRQLVASQTRLRTVTWAQLASLPPIPNGFWRNSDTFSNSTNASVVAFANANLPASYKTVISPYEAARRLYQALLRTVAFNPSPGNQGVASAVLSSRRADNYGLCTTLVALLRVTGIPARTSGGFLSGNNQGFWMVEVFFPGFGWMPVDPLLGKSLSPTGRFAFAFGFVPRQNSFVRVTSGVVSMPFTPNPPVTTVAHPVALLYTGTPSLDLFATNFTLNP